MYIVLIVGSENISWNTGETDRFVKMNIRDGLDGVLTQFSFCQGIIQWRTCTTYRLVHTRAICSYRDPCFTKLANARAFVSHITLLLLFVTLRRYSVSLVEGRMRRLR